jgi:hypothetical protein
MKSLILLTLLLIGKISSGQQAKTVYRNPKDSSQNFYIITLPKDAVKGLLVLNARILADSSKKTAYNLGICTLTVIPTGNNIDNLTSNSILNTIDGMIGDVIRTYHISSKKIIIGGMSAAGTGSVRYAQYCFLNKSSNGIKPCGVFGVDPPLDYERLYNESHKATTRNFSKDAIEESKMLMGILIKDLKGTPQTNILSYQKNSPFSYSATNGGNAYLLNHLAVRIYTEPDINWWIDNRRKDYYDLNAIDDAALVNQLKLNGNSNAELIVTNNKGLKIEGHPHSWSIVDEHELLLWCTKIFSESK